MSTPVKCQHQMSSLYNYQHQQHQQQAYAIGKTLKVSPSRRLKNMIKPLLVRFFKSKAKQAKRSSYIGSDEQEFDWLHNDMDNMANEQLENRLIEEIHDCDDGAAIIVYNEDGTRCVETVDKEDFYVPVHFARTNAGTFFWTSMQRETMQPYQIEWHFLDRWAQA